MIYQIALIDNNLISYTDLFAEKGKDFESEIKQIAKDKLLIQELMSSGNGVSEDQVSSVKEVVDAYGAGVRGGSITPQLKDEEYLRVLLNLPQPEKPVLDAWEDDGGARRPITLKSQEAFQTEQTEIVDESPEVEDS